MVVPWIAILVVDVLIGSFSDLAIPDGFPSNLVPGSTVDLVPLGAVVLPVLFLVIPWLGHYFPFLIFILP